MDSAATTAAGSACCSSRPCAWALHDEHLHGHTLVSSSGLGPAVCECA